MKHYHKNPRQITKKQLEDLGVDLKELGDLSGITHDLDTDEILTGNQRCEALPGVMSGLVQPEITQWSGYLRESGSEKKVGHPTQKALGVILDLIEFHNDETIADLFAGSGTTLVACENLSRKCRAVEISPAYCAVTLQRMADAFPALEIKRIDPATEARGEQLDT